MLRPLWQRIVNTVYNAVSSVFYTQEEIDDNIEDRFTETGVSFTYDSGSLSGFKARKRQFWTAEDAIKYILDGIPVEYVTVLILPDWDNEGNSAYIVYVEEG